MKKFWDIFSLVRNYKRSVYANIFFNVIGAVLSLFTFGALVPMLRILFGTFEESPQPPVVEDVWSGKYWYELFSYNLDTYIKDEGALQALAWMCVGIVIVALLKNLTTYLAMNSIATVRTAVSRDLRGVLYAKILRLPLSFFAGEKKGDIISRMSNDLMEIEFSVIGVLDILFKSPVIIIVYLTTLFTMSWKLTLFALLFLPISGFLISRIAKSLKNAAGRGKEELGRLISTIEETLGGMRIIKAFNAEETFNTRFDQQNNRYFRLMQTLYKREYLSSPMSEFVSIIVLSILLLAGGYIILQGDSWMDGELFILYLIVFSQIIPPARSLSDAIFKIKKGEASIDRVNEIRDAKETITDAPDALSLESFDKEIRFENVSFRYDKEWVLKDISFTIPKGTTTALVGPSGGGKSTLADLLSRFYDVQEGRILLDGKDIKHYKVSDLRQQMGIVSQQSILFNDSIAANISMGSKVHDEQRMRDAAKSAHAAEFVDQFPEGYAHSVGEQGNKLSGGQKQRVSIARALYKNPPILILDEATSALDTQSELLVQQAIEKLMENRTSLVIAHRLSTIQHAQQILVIQGGKIVEQGNHSELLDKQGVYQNLVQLQQLG